MNPSPQVIRTQYSKRESKHGFMFFGLLWIIFMLPNAYWTAIPFVIGHTNFSEFALMLLPLVYRLYPKRKAKWHSRSLQTTIIVFWLACFLGVLVQFLYERSSPVSLIKTNRIMLPLMVSTALLFLGPRLSSMRILYHFFGAITCSFVISFIANAIGFQFSGFGGAQLEEGAYNVGQHGRLYNVNSSFSYFAIAITATLIGSKKSLDFSKAKYPRNTIVAIVASLIGGVLTFNRTFLGIGALFLMISSMMIFKPKVVATAISLIIVGGAAALVGYTYNDTVQRQVDRRIIEPFQEGRLREKMVHEGRLNGYRIYRENLLHTSRGVTGVPPGAVGYYTKKGFTNVNASDISFVTVWWRFGAFALLMWLAVLIQLAKRIMVHRRMSHSSFYKNHASFLLISMVLLALASLNIDVLAHHYPIVHLAILVIALRDSSEEQ